MSAAPKDPAIKLFGKTIPLPDSLASVDDHRSPLHHRISNYVTEKENSVAKLDAIDHKDEAGPLRTADESTKVEKNKEEKTLQKPDKIIPCPRCTSMDTKFCYYNNYNVNQPRHFCKNCQRYWTAGGNIRNVPIGAGRRKSKNSVSTYQSQADVVNAFHQQILRPNKGIGTVLAFGSDSLPCESMTSTLNLAEKPILTSNSRIGNFQISVPEGGRQSDNDTSRSSNEIVNNTTKIPSEVPYCSGPLWPYSWNPARWSRQLPHPSTVCPPGFSMPCHPAVAYSGCTVPGTWNSPWLARLPSPIQKGQESGPVSTKMGKHLRDENIGSLSISEFDEKHKQKSLHKCFWVPKTLRIGESETTKSSLWETQGMKSEKGESTNYTGLADTFHRDPNLPNSALQANPAALSRSLKFHESS